jgi:hypothetical protein
MSVNPFVITLDDFFPRFLQLVFVQRAVDLERDLFSQFLRVDPLRALDLDLVDERARLQNDHHLHAFAFGLAEDAHVLHLAGPIKRLDVLFDDRFGIRLARFGPHLRQDFVA